MSKVTKPRIIRIGNSRGIKIPKVWMEQLGLGEEVELSVHNDRLVVRPLRRARQGWEERIRAALKKQGPEPHLEDWPPTTWDLTEWES